MSERHYLGKKQQNGKLAILEGKFDKLENS